MTKKLAISLTIFALLLLSGLVCWLALIWSRPSGPLASGKLADGRILQVEGVTFGTSHKIGGRSPLERFEHWLPGTLTKWFEPKHPHSEITMEQPGLVVWVNALDPATGKNVDCQMLRVEFVDQNGDLFGDDTRSWFGGPAFWRVGHIFHAFPRTQPRLVLRATPWNSRTSITLEIPNPCLTTPKNWVGAPLPQEKRVGNVDIVLAGLEPRTNGSPKHYWETSSQYWEPTWSIRRKGGEAADWDAPEWSAEDPIGNQGKYLGLRQPVLRFVAKSYPSATNLQDSVLVGTLPAEDLINLRPNAWRDLTLTNGAARFSVLGLLGPGSYVFAEGRFETNPAMRMGPVKGGAPSGWQGQIRRISPLQVKNWHGHYTPVPVVYIRAPSLAQDERLGLRLLDERGKYWLAESEPQGATEGIWPFLLKLPPEVKTVSGEVVVLRPIKADFLVKVPKPQPP